MLDSAADPRADPPHRRWVRGADVGVGRADLEARAFEEATGDPGSRVAPQRLDRIAFGGMAATPKRAAALETALVGRAWTETGVSSVLDTLEQDFQPIDDMRASAAYRLQAAQNLIVRAWLESAGAKPTRVLDAQAVAHG